MCCARQFPSHADSNAPTPSIFSLAYFMRFFDVTSAQVLTRLGRSLVPFGRPFFSGQDSKPDLYALLADVASAVKTSPDCVPFLEFL